MSNEKLTKLYGEKSVDACGGKIARGCIPFQTNMVGFRLTEKEFKGRFVLTTFSLKFLKPEINGIAVKDIPIGGPGSVVVVWKNFFINVPENTVWIKWDHLKFILAERGPECKRKPLIVSENYAIQSNTVASLWYAK